MKTIARIAILCAVTVVAGLTFATTFNPELLHSHQGTVKPQTEGLHTNNVVRQIWDSGLYPFNDVTISIFWLNDSTLVFSAGEYAKPTTWRDENTSWLYLWRLGEKPLPYGKDPKEAAHFYRAARGQMCFQQKKVNPVTGEVSEVLMKGSPGGEQEAAPWDNRLKGLPFNFRQNDIELIDCEQYVDPAMAERIFFVDPHHQYYLERAPKSDWPPAVGRNPVLMRSDGSNRKTLPIPFDEVGTIYFRMFDNVFWILESNLGPFRRWDPKIDGPPPEAYQKWKATNCLAVWRVDPTSASTERRCIPFGPWSGREYDATHHGSPLISLVPTARGLFFTSTDYADGPPTHVGPSGLYKLENGPPQRIIAGYLEHATPSPNGCRVAFVYGPNWTSHNYGTPGSWTIAAIDLCSAEPQPHMN